MRFRFFSNQKFVKKTNVASFLTRKIYITKSGVASETFRRNMSSPSSESKSKPNKKPAVVCRLLLLISCPEDGGEHIPWKRWGLS
jgi:hypothetical protein